MSKAHRVQDTYHIQKTCKLMWRPPFFIRFMQNAQWLELHTHNDVIYSILVIND